MAENLQPWKIRRVVLIGIAVFCGALAWYATGINSAHSADIARSALWAMVAAGSVYALGVSAEQVITLIKIWKDKDKPID